MKREIKQKYHRKDKIMGCYFFNILFIFRNIFLSSTRCDFWRKSHQNKGGISISPSTSPNRPRRGVKTLPALYHTFVCLVFKKFSFFVSPMRTSHIATCTSKIANAAAVKVIGNFAPVKRKFCKNYSSRYLAYAFYRAPGQRENSAE